MVEADQRTCTLRVSMGQEGGSLYFNRGILKDAEAGDLKGVAAAYRVMGWHPHCEVEIFDGSGSEGRTIELPATQILLEALSRRDEVHRSSHPEALRPGRLWSWPPKNGASSTSNGSSGHGSTASEFGPSTSDAAPFSRAKPIVRKEEPEIAMRITSLPEILDAFRADVPGFVSTDIVEVESGLSISGGSVDPNFDASVASASYAEVVKSNARALQLLGMESSTTEDVLITTKSTYFLIRMLGATHYHLLAISRQGNLGLARVIMKRYEPQFLQAIA
jgi:predicted regulator of Ras-like GTPase activity (Roadblock/LC7/MglB family)